MYLIRTNDPEALHELTQSPDAINDFTNCDLGALNTLALIELCEDAAGWISVQPVVFDESHGLAIFAFEQDGVLWLVKNAEALAEFDADIESLLTFADAPGAVYALDAF